MTDPHKIANRLTEAQRLVILDATVRRALGSLWGYEPVQVNAGGDTVALSNKGIIRSVELVSISGRRSRIYALTPLGLKVKRILEEQNNDH